ncbi:MAG: hypothetical protein ACYC0M_04605 [Burkholderiales bacterium]
MKQIRFFMILAMFLFAGQAVGDSSVPGGYGSVSDGYGNAYNRNSGTNRSVDRQRNANPGNTLQSSHSSGYFPMGSDLFKRPAQPDRKQASGREAD